MALTASSPKPSAAVPLPYLSHSRVDKYLLCPEQYRLHYVEGLRPRHLSANLAFGSAVHEALASLFQKGDDPKAAFSGLWESAKSLELSYSKRDSWERLSEVGEAVLDHFLDKELSRISEVSACEKPFELALSGLDVPFIGVVDLVAHVDGKRTLVDFKTSGASYADYQVALSDQLTAYQMADPTAARVAFCVFLKTKTPAIHWHYAGRSGAHFSEYVEKVHSVAGAIAQGLFYKRPGRWCSWCDFLPVCMGDRAKADSTLVRAES